MRSQRRAPIETLSPYLLDVPQPGMLPPDSPLLAPQPPIRWQELFANDHPVVIEVGFGKGLFLLQQGQSHPDTNYLGIEIERKYVLFTATRIAKRQLPNVKLACTDARWFLKERIAAKSVAAIHVYFPDPWWKKRHQKRKLFNRDFLEQCARVLQGGGELHFASDVADYFAESMAHVHEVPAFTLLPTPISQPNDPFLTNFERKYRLEGRPIHRAILQRSV